MLAEKSLLMKRHNSRDPVEANAGANRALTDQHSQGLPHSLGTAALRVSFLELFVESNFKPSKDDSTPVACEDETQCKYLEAGGGEEEKGSRQEGDLEAEPDVLPRTGVDQHGLQLEGYVGLYIAEWGNVGLCWGRCRLDLCGLRELLAQRDTFQEGHTFNKSEENLLKQNPSQQGSLLGKRAKSSVFPWSLMGASSQSLPATQAPSAAPEMTIRTHSLVSASSTHSSIERASFIAQYLPLTCLLLFGNMKYCLAKLLATTEFTLPPDLGDNMCTLMLISLRAGRKLEGECLKAYWLGVESSIAVFQRLPMAGGSLRAFDAVVIEVKEEAQGTWIMNSEMTEEGEYEVKVVETAISA
ncbi:hypothetical protein BDK51DRAFT_27752 [Blyttiomyces helicus]|uniref:Uncharacterized protein n=1 Tax=Blyttiomyces helicus TaxID=388810 RepID=A0A4V1ISL7_9FUNG|nr:hypothetical protein BDK51DRAFT_27752 [Blyttiomyces helicus]|eukprot:RKO93997.1 hypothetical protein BDK51DRAFT_27752 [Blyttiomyces helicus]